MNNVQEKSPVKAEQLSSTVLFALLIRIALVFYLVVVWAGYLFFDGLWPAPVKLWLFTILGVLSIVTAFFWPRATASVSDERPLKRFIDRQQAFLVLVLILVEGIVLFWIIWGPPGALDV